MFTKIVESEKDFYARLKGGEFLDGVCSSWSGGNGLFLWEPEDDAPSIVTFEEGGHYHCYKMKMNLEVDPKKNHLPLKGTPN